MPVRCDQCGVEEYMPYVCKMCKGRFCAAHRLPENHDCQGLGLYRERVRREGRIFASEPGTPLQPQVSSGARATARLDDLWRKVNGKMTYVLLGVILAVYVLEWMTVVIAPGLFDDLFVIQRDVLVQPWTILTSMLAHAVVDAAGRVAFNHILFNGIALFFFGMALERLIGTKRFTGLFFVTGAVAGIAQVGLFGGGALGASGAIQGILGTLVVLAPRLSVYVMGIFPVPLWAFAAFYVLFDILGAFDPLSTTGHVAHLTGFALGALYGAQLRKQGLRAHVPERPFKLRRYL